MKCKLIQPVCDITIRISDNHKDKVNIAIIVVYYNIQLNHFYIQQCEVVIVYLHWGTEYTVLQSREAQIGIIKKLQVYADVIIGSHPHVINGHFYYNNTLVIQSLGNFLFPMNLTPHTVCF